MLSPNSIFRSICSAIEPTLILHGFSKTEDENHPEIFGSEYATFENEKERIRILWDGKEQWFALETISQKYPANRKDILLQHFEPKEATDKTVDEIVAAMHSSLSEYLNAIEN